MTTALYRPKPGSIADRALKLLKKGATYCRELAQNLGVSRNAIHACLRRLVEAGVVLKTSGADAATTESAADEDVVYSLAPNAHELIDRQPSTRERAIALLEAGPQSVIGLADRLNVRPQTIAQTMAEDIAAGRVVRVTITSPKHVPRLGYQLPDQNQAAAGLTVGDVLPRRSGLVPRTQPTAEALFWANPFGRPVPSA